MDKKQTDLLRRRVKLGAQMDALIAQLAEVLREVRQVHGEISMEVNQKQGDENFTVSNIISNFEEIMGKRLKMAFKDRPSPSGQSLEELFTKDNIGIASRLEAPIHPKESPVDYIKRTGNKVQRERC